MSLGTSLSPSLYTAFHHSQAPQIKIRTVAASTIRPMSSKASFPLKVFPGGSNGEESAHNLGDPGSIPG